MMKRREPARLAPRLRALCAGFAGRLPAADRADILDLVDHGEEGVALENLCAQLEEHDVRPTGAERAEIRALAAQMGLAAWDWRFAAG